MKLEVDLGYCRRSGNLVKESCHLRDATVVVPGCAAVEFLIELGAAHVFPGLAVFWEHRGMSGGICTLFCKLFAQICSPFVKFFKVQLGKSFLIGVIILSEDNSKCLLLDHFNFRILFLGQATVKHRGSKLKNSADSSLVNNTELVSCSTQVLEPDKDPEIFGGAPGDVGDMCRPAEVTGEGNPK